MPLPFPLTDIPEGVTYDGIQPALLFRQGDSYAFSDTVTHSSFTILVGKFTAQKLADTVDSLRKLFAESPEAKLPAPSCPLPPVARRVPLFARPAPGASIPDTHHY